MAPRNTYRVSEVARISGVTVRTLHHYDEIGLLVPSERTEAGYRLYAEEDLLRLQQILLGREQGLALEDVRRSLDDPGFDHRQALLAHRQQLQQRAKRTDAMIRAVDAALAIHEGAEGRTMDMQELFDGFDPTEYEAEAQERWGHSDAYRESAKRTKRYTPDDWRRLGEEQAAIYADAVAALQANQPPDSTEAMEIAERHRDSMTRWFYPCSHAMHAGLADLYEADQRFTTNIDRFGTGLTQFLSAAIRANALRHER